MKRFKICYPLLLTLIIIMSGVPLCAQNGPAMQMQWGEFGDKPGQFKYPTMIAANKNSNIYVVDQHNHRIQEFDQNGNFILMWGSQGEGPGQFNFPYGIALDSKGNVFVTDMNNNRIQKFSPAGSFISAVGTYGTGDGQFKYPYGIAIDENDVLYVIDAFNYRIQKLDNDLKFISKWGSQETIGFKLYMPHELAVAKDGNIVLSDRQNHRIAVFSKNGELVKRFGDFGEGKETKGGLFSEPHGVAVNDNGELLVCDRYNFRIQKFTSSEEFSNMWVTSGVMDNSKHFPLGIVAPKNGFVYVTDHYAHCVQKY